MEKVRSVMSGAPVASVLSSDTPKFPKLKELADWVGGQWESLKRNVIKRADIGEIIVDRRGAKSSGGHGIGADKASAFLAVPDIIEKGEILSREPDRSGGATENIFIAAPIKIDGKDFVGVVRLRADSEGTRFYVHEVQLKEGLQKPFNTGAVSSDHGGFGAAWKTVHDALSVNQTNFSIAPANYLTDLTARLDYTTHTAGPIGPAVGCRRGTVDRDRWSTVGWSCIPCMSTMRSCGLLLEPPGLRTRLRGQELQIRYLPNA